MEEDPNPEVMATDSTGGQRPEDGTHLPGQSAIAELSTSCDGATDTLKPIKEESQSQIMPPSKRTADDTSNMDTNGRQFKKTRVEEIVDQAVGADVMETDPVGDDQQVHLQHPAETTNDKKHTETQQDMTDTKDHHNTNMPQSDAVSDQRHENKPESSNNDISGCETRQVAIKQEVDDTAGVGVNNDLNQINKQHSVQNTNNDICMPEAPVEETEEHPEIETMDVDAANNHRQANVQQLRSTGGEKPAENTGEAPSIMHRLNTTNERGDDKNQQKEVDKMDRFNDGKAPENIPGKVVIKQEHDEDVTESVISESNHTENQNAKEKHMDEGQVEETLEQDHTDARLSAKEAKTNGDSESQKETDKQQTVNSDPFDFKASKRSEQLAGFRNAAHPSCTTEQRKLDEEEIKESLKYFGKMKSNDGKWLHPKLNVSLFTDQMIGVALMKKLEENGNGGILADQMGFGKTAQIIALVVSATAPKKKRKRRKQTKRSKKRKNKKNDDEDESDDSEGNDDGDDGVDTNTDIPYNGSKCTLIVGPPRSSKQLLDECNRFVSEETEITVAPYRRKHVESGFRPASFKKHEFIITTYGEVVAEYRMLMDLLQDRNLTLRDDWQGQIESRAIPFLFATKFWRVVLDESHQTRNLLTLRARACHALQREKSWCVSATPYINTPWDLYSQMQFVGDPNAQTRKAFKKTYHVTKESDDLQTFEEKLKHLMIRRTSANKRFGHPIIPKVVVHRRVVKISLSPNERAFIQLIKEKFEDMANKKEGPLGLPLMRLLRLRQAITSPFMLESFMIRDFDKQDLEDMTSRLRELNLEMDMLPNINRDLRSEGGFTQGTQDKVRRANPRTDEGEIELLGLSAAFRVSICGMCTGKCVEKRVLECGHVFCKACILPKNCEETEEGLRLHCLLCKKHYLIIQPNGQTDAMNNTDTLEDISQTTPFSGEEEEEDDDKDKYWSSTVQENEAPRAKKSKPQRGKKKKGEKGPETRPGYDYRSYRPLLDKHQTRWLQEADRTKNLALLGRGKIGPCAELIEQITHKHPGDKIIAFTQFTEEASIIGRLLQHLNITFVYINGMMSRKQTDDTLKEMAENPEITVMITALKCGGESLNCQFANHVVLIDPWWNNALEEQAIGRVARLGQQKEVYVYRMIAEGTADDEVSRIQERKQGEAAQLIGETPAHYFEFTYDELHSALH